MLTRFRDSEASHSATSKQALPQQDVIRAGEAFRVYHKVMKPLRFLFVWILALMAVPCSVAAETGDAGPRTPQYPLKTQRTLRTGANIANARNNIAKFPSARKMADDYIKAADKWLE